MKIELTEQEARDLVDAIYEEVQAVRSLRVAFTDEAKARVERLIAISKRLVEGLS